MFSKLLVFLNTARDLCSVVMCVSNSSLHITYHVSSIIIAIAPAVVIIYLAPVCDVCARQRDLKRAYVKTGQLQFAQERASN